MTQTRGSNALSPAGTAPGRREVLIVFAALILFNLWAVSVGWKNVNLPGCEFRQAQTAISAFFIQQDHDFSLAYPTPVLGRPWSIPMEFPLYQWSAVWLSNATGISLTPAGRTVSAVCFYFALPAFYLLLARLGLERTQRWIVLGFILTCPLYIFYARSFLIETMALMFGAWYLAALVETMTTRRVRWLTICVVAGTGAGLVKVTTFAVFLFPAFVCSLVWLWRSRPVGREQTWSPVWRTFGWLVASHAVPFLAVEWWVRFSDSVKILNPSGEALVSYNLATWNFGLGQRFSPDVWVEHWHIYFRELVSPVTGILCVVSVVFVARRWVFLSLGLTAVFLAVQLVFPILYARHEYYYVANAFALMAAGAMIMTGLVQSKLPRAAAFGILLAAYGSQIALWYRGHYPEQNFHGQGGTSLNRLFNFITDSSESIIVVGDDWNSMIPYYAQRRALMLRDDIIRAPEKFAQALEQMKDANVTALVVLGQWRGNGDVVEKIGRRLDIDERPALVSEDSIVYFQRAIRAEAIKTLQGHGMNRFGEFTLSDDVTYRDRTLANQVLIYAQLSERHKKLFRNFQPKPQSSFSSVEPQLWEENGEMRFFAHPETKLWFALAPGTYRLRTTLAMTASSYSGVPFSDATDGVWLTATVIDRSGARNEVQHLSVNPRDHEADRGVINVDWPFTMPEGAEFELAVSAGPKGNSARDWATLGAVILAPEPGVK